MVLSSIVGFVGGHHFYLGRWAEGVVDAGLTVAWVVCFALDQIVLGVLFVVADFGHALVVTILLLTGNFRDGEGRLVYYPGQPVRSRRDQGAAGGER